MNRLSRRLETLERKLGGYLSPILIFDGDLIPEGVDEARVVRVITGVPWRKPYMDEATK